MSCWTILYGNTMICVQNSVVKLTFVKESWKPIQHDVTQMTISDFVISAVRYTLSLVIQLQHAGCNNDNTTRM